MKKLILLFLSAVVFIGVGVIILRHQRINEVVTEAETMTEETPATAPAEQKAAAATTAVPDPDNGIPRRVRVASVGLDVAVANGYYNRNTQKWTLSRNKAHFATMTERLNSKTGNTYIYGHNRKEVFARLTKVRPGAEAEVYSETGHKYTYRMVKSITTKPEDSSMLFYEGSPILTLQTCTGAFYQNRTLYVFELVGVDNA